MVVKFTSEMIADASGGSSGLGFLVVINSLKIQTGVTSSKTSHTRVSKTNAKSQTGHRILSFQIVPDRYIHRKREILQLSHSFPYSLRAATLQRPQI